jgi:hypothetical protein
MDQRSSFALKFIAFIALPILVGQFWGDIIFKSPTLWHFQFFLIAPLSIFVGCIVATRKEGEVNAFFQSGIMGRVLSPFRIFRPKSAALIPVMFAIAGPAWTYGIFTVAAHVAGGTPVCYDSIVGSSSRGEVTLSLINAPTKSIVTIHYNESRRARPQPGEQMALRGFVNLFGTVVTEKRRFESCPKLKNY